MDFVAKCVRNFHRNYHAFLRGEVSVKVGVMEFGLYRALLWDEVIMIIIVI